MRPMYLECPDDEVCWRTADQYFLGPDLLVAPVMSNVKSRKVYLPQGDWMNFWDRKPERGPQWIEVKAPLDTIPVFARADAIIPVQFNSRFELGGEFRQDEKDRLLPGFLVFSQAPLNILTKLQVFDPRETKDVYARLEASVDKGKIILSDLAPLPSAVLVYGPRPKSVSAFGRNLDETSCEKIAAFGTAWCYREKDSAAIVFLGRK